MSATYYETCKSCKHVFKPKKLNKLLLEKRLDCICACHWSDKFDWASGITDEQAIQLTQQKQDSVK